MFRTSREMLARETWEWLYLTEVLTVLTARSRGDKNGWKRVIKKMLTGSLSHFSRRHHRPLSQVARVLFSLCSFNTSPLYYLRAWHRLNFWHRADDFKAQHSQFSTCKPIGPTCNVAPVLEILGVPRLPPGDSLGTGKRGAVPKIWLAVPNFLARVNGVFMVSLACESWLLPLWMEKQTSCLKGARIWWCYLIQ